MKASLEDLADGNKYRVVTIGKTELEILSALHYGVLLKSKDDLASKLADRIANAKDFTEVEDWMKEVEKGLEGAHAITKLLTDILTILDRNGIAKAVRMLLTKPELEYFIKLANLPVNYKKAEEAGFATEMINKADELIAQVKAVLDASEAPTQDDIDGLLANNSLANAMSNPFKTPIGKA